MSGCHASVLLLLFSTPTPRHLLPEYPIGVGNPRCVLLRALLYLQIPPVHMPEADRYQHYEVLKRADGSLWELGRGAMGITYKAYDTNLRCPVALKVINAAFLDSETARQRFLREARAAAALRHPNVASVFHLGTDHGNYFYAMEFIDGETMDEYMKRHGRLDPVEALELALQVTRALAAAARQHLVHRDLKPANLMLVDEDGEKVLKVIDFGLAKSVKREGDDSGALTVGGGFVGTPHFASPEQLEERDIDLRSDIYSLGATLYYLVTGRPPFSGAVAQIMSQHLYRPVPTEPLLGCPPAFAHLILRMMKKDPGERPQSPAELRQEIQACLLQARERPATNQGQDSAIRPAIIPETEATLELASSRGVTVGEVFAGQYRVDQALPDHIAGQCFAGFDLHRQAAVNLLVLSRAFLADTNRYAHLKKAVDQVLGAPHPGLRQVLALETVSKQTVLVEESVVGPSLRELLRIRGALTASEVIPVLQRLAPVADHARMNGLEHVDFSLSGIQLTGPAVGLSEAEQAQQLQKPLQVWPELTVRVTPIDFTFDAVPSWAGEATLVQPTGLPGGPRGSYVRQLSLLAYELFGGPRTTMETQGRYTPIAALPEEGNHLLRQGMVDDVATAAELCAGLASAVPYRGATSVLPPVGEAKSTSTGAVAAAGAAAASGTRSGFPAVPPPLPPGEKTAEPVRAPVSPPTEPPASAAVAVRNRSRTSRAGLLMIWVCGIAVLAALGWGGYALYRRLGNGLQGSIGQL
ncbi:MAG TPA: protein kinase, partial [Chthoniobacterales bacterium]